MVAGEPGDDPWPFAREVALARRLCTDRGMFIGSEGVQLLKATLEEEKATDLKLSEFAEKAGNAKAAALVAKIGRKPFLRVDVTGDSDQQAGLSALTTSSLGSRAR